MCDSLCDRKIYMVVNQKNKYKLKLLPHISKVSINNVHFYLTLTMALLH